jgi:non-ribosomal peptide synthetase component F
MNLNNGSRYQGAVALRRKPFKSAEPTRMHQEGPRRDHVAPRANLPLEQQAIRAKCVHPTGTFVPFVPAALEQSISTRFEQQVHRYPAQLAVKTPTQAFTYAALNSLANRVAGAILAQQEEGHAPIGLLCDQGALGIAALLGY